MEWRIGVHLGDVLIEGDDILGDGVNICRELAPGRTRRGNRAAPTVAAAAEPLLFGTIVRRRWRRLKRCSSR